MIQQPIISPTLKDLAFIELSQVLVNGLSWLDNCYGPAQILERKKGKQEKYPGIIQESSTGLEYEDLLPNAALGNFAFTLPNDPSNVRDFTTRSNITIEQGFAIIFWVDLRKAYPDDWKQRTREHLKSDVLRLLGSSIFRNSKGINISEISDTNDRIYREFDFKQIENQSLMRPFTGFRLECSFQIELTCI